LERAKGKADESTLRGLYEIIESPADFMNGTDTSIIVEAYGLIKRIHETVVADPDLTPQQRDQISSGIATTTCNS